jgi:hypothetical protein
MLAVRHLAATLLLAGAASFAQAADMLGDTLLFQRAYPTPTTPYWNNDDESATVVAGSADRIDWYANFTNGFFLRVDPEATSIGWNLVSPSTFVGVAGGEFDGFVITGFSNDIVGVSVLSNNSGLAPFIAFTAREVQVSLRGNNFGGDTGFVLGIEFAPAIPEPGTWALMLAGMAGVALRARRRR